MPSTSVSSIHHIYLIWSIQISKPYANPQPRPAQLTIGAGHFVSPQGVNGRLKTGRFDREIGFYLVQSHTFSHICVFSTALNSSQEAESQSRRVAALPDLNGKFPVSRRR